MINPSLTLSQQAKDLGKQLIKELNIQPGIGISDYLGVSRRYHNMDAIFVWIQNNLDEGNFSYDINKIKRNFKLLMPESLSGF